MPSDFIRNPRNYNSETLNIDLEIDIFSSYLLSFCRTGSKGIVCSFSPFEKEDIINIETITVHDEMVHHSLKNRRCVSHFESNDRDINKEKQKI